MVPPLLKLTFVQGPIEGQSREFKAGSTIRIGRVLRGNEITIKDKGISTNHLKIVSDSDNWIIQDLGSSNGTTVNLEDLDPDTPVNLSHGDVIRLGGDTIIKVYFVVVDVKPQETSKLPPRPRRNNRRVADPEPDPDNVEPVQEAPKKTRAGTRGRTVEDEVPVEKKVSSRAGRGKKKNIESDEITIEPVQEIPKKTRGRRAKTLDEIVEKETESEVVTRVTRSRRNEKEVEVIDKEEEAPVEKTGRGRRGKNNESLGLDSVKLEIENTPKGVEIPPVKRATRSKQIGNESLALKNVKSEDITLEEQDEQRVIRPTRSKRKEIGGDSYAELDLVLKQARESRAKKRKTVQKPPEIVEMEARSDEDVVEDKGKERDVEEDEIPNSVEQLEIESEKREDGETEKLEDSGLLEKECQDLERDCRSEEKQPKSVEMEARNDGDIEQDEENEDQKACSDDKCDTEDEKLKRVEQVEIESKKSSLEEDVEIENLQDIGSLEEECHDCNSAEMEGKNDYDVEEDQKSFSNDKLGKEDEISQSKEQVEIELTNRSLGEHGETEKLQDTSLIEDECRDSERECKSEKKQSESVEQVEIEVTKRSLGEHGETEKLHYTGLIEDECRDLERDCKSEEKQSESVEMDAGNDDDVEDKENDDQRLIEMEVENVDVEDGMVNEKHNEGCSERSDDKHDTEEEISQKVEQIEIELKKGSTLLEDGEAEKLQDTGLIEDECCDSERDCKSEEKQPESVEKEAGNDDDDEDKANDDHRLKNIEMEVVEEGIVKKKHTESCSERSDEELDTEEEIDFKSKEAGSEASEKVERVRSDKNEDKPKADIRNMTLREWFDYLEKVYFREQITKETEELIAPMRSKALRLKQYIAEQKQAMRKGL